MRFGKIIKRRRLYEEIVDEIERMVLEGELQEGDQLPAERELTEAFGVGRTAVREALFALERKGLIATSSGERARVTRPTARRLIKELAGVARHVLSEGESVEHFQQARLVIDTALARLAAEVRTEEDMALLKKALADNKRAIEHPEDAPRTDIPFHYVLPIISRNPLFMALHEAMTDWLMDVREVVHTMPGAPEDAYHDHVRIYEAIAARDPDGAATAMREHLEKFGSLYRQAKKERTRPRRGR
jgi:GntR family transcriptional regulator, sialic acid-inducible nan operon repressor